MMCLCRGTIMARPHRKSLLGKEAGKPAQHWYDYLLSRRRIKQQKLWDGGCPNSKPGTWYIIATPIEQKR